MKKFKWLTSGFIMVIGVFLFSVSAYAYSYDDVRHGRLTGNHVRVRTSPCLESDNILFQVSRGQVVEILDVDGDFYRVNVRDNREVYIFRDFVEEFEMLPLPERTGEFIYDLLAYAKSYIGTPYRFGSTDPSRGFDCSGFVTVVMREFGVNLQRSSAAMAANNGHYVPRNALHPGDLVFFATGSGPRISHVGIYIGGDQFIHSASVGGVKISGMNEAYYRSRFVRANRVV